MGTQFSEIISEYALTEITDIRLTNLMSTNPALFYRKMALYMLNAIPRFNRPPEVRSWLQFTAPAYDDYLFTANSAQASPATVETGKLGFELCSAGIVGTDEYGNTDYTPVSNLQYDAETGIAVFENALSEGDRVEFDFYTDGAFSNTLTYEMKRILGLCAQYVWESKFANDYLLQLPKIKDKNFSTEAEGNTSRAATERLDKLKKALDGEIMNFEQSLAYLQSVPVSKNLKFPT